MNKKNNLTLIVLLFLVSIFGNNVMAMTGYAQSAKPVAGTLAKMAPSLKIATGATAAIGINFALDYISTYAHEHGHGLTSRDPSYKVIITPSMGFIPNWNGVTVYKNPESKLHNILTCLAGPTAGIATTYLQCAGVKILDDLAHNRSLKNPLTHVKNYLSGINNIPEYSPNTQSLLSHTLNFIMYFRCSRIIREIIYGFFPYYNEKIKLPSDGCEAWKEIFGDNCPTFGFSIFTTIISLLFIPSGFSFISQLSLSL